MASSTANAPVFDEVVDYCCTCTFNMVKFPETRCELDFSSNSTKCVLCNSRRLGKNRQCVAVCEEAKYEAADLVAAAKQLNAVNEELANLRKKEEDIVNQKKKNKLRAMIFECKKRRDAAATVHEQNGDAFKAVVKKLGGIDKVALERQKEAGEAASNKTAVPRPSQTPLTVDEQLLLAARSAVKAIDEARNKVDKLREILPPNYNATGDDKPHPEVKKKLDNLMRKVEGKDHKLSNKVIGLTSRLQGYKYKSASVYYDSGDDDLSDVQYDDVEMEDA
ncbi:hypothetical protein VSDG_00488 [Cytospora chrysosperma]|uniref:Uncharacterized protein n=1 Tax=Cytospora chrysosperma TaxID=252740 RepID=A0A423WQK2_CYTCH|nr:hypothetical protein VSDG_00488 [Valsa sordida]